MPECDPAVSHSPDSAVAIAAASWPETASAARLHRRTFADGRQTGLFGSFLCPRWLALFLADAEGPVVAGTDLPDVPAVMHAESAWPAPFPHRSYHR